MIGQRFRRNWFPDEQVAPERVLDALQARRRLATTDPEVFPWMSAADIGIALGLVNDRRSWGRSPDDRPSLVDPKVCHRAMPHGVYWQHAVAARDVRAAINHYEAEGVIIRLPHPLARWGVEVWPLDDADRAALVDAWLTMEEARENARHVQRKHRIDAGRRAAGAA